MKSLKSFLNYYTRAVLINQPRCLGLVKPKLFGAPVPVEPETHKILIRILESQIQRIGQVFGDSFEAEVRATAKFF